ncbi:AAA family ATPase [Microbacterium aquilitoris]|uniref:AAA family ATPase n=1 Tax=Microbacterium aquilitoris TaxID=3067307 RepID=UPI00288E98F4|nr:AAA family ATPase [Microbacterium sp. KSW2-22]MDT3346075.1 AAA family ATPase [Microbacterium sp. KSW2-22]
MAEARITRLTRIDSFRAFQRWTDDGASDAFKRVNVVYGTNGSGKSTLAHLFRAAADGALEDGVKVEFAATSGTRTIRVTEESTDFWACVRVFNEKYVTENLRFDDVNGPSPDSLLTLGQTNVANEAELESKKARRETARAELDQANSDLRAKVRQLENRLTSIAGQVVADLSASGIGRYKATNVYNKGHVRTHLEGGGVLGAASPSEDLKLALAPRPETLTLPVQGVIGGSELLGKAAELLGRSVSSVVLDEIREEPGRAQWVQEGIHLHDGRDTCLFCGGVLTDERQAALAAHFDDALTRLQQDIDRLVAELERSMQEADGFYALASVLRSTYDDLQEAGNAALAEYELKRTAFIGRAQNLVDVLGEKRRNPFSASTMVGDVALDAPSAEPVLRPFKEHNARAAQHSQLVDAAAHRVELAKIGAFAAEYAELNQAIDAGQEAAKALETEISELTNRIITLENVETDPLPKAEELTRHVSRLLGRIELEFRMDEATKRYRIERNGAPATHLSEGERTAIALLHFLIGVRQDSVAGDPPVIVIDDPVSSLDDSILFGVSSYLWAELVTKQYVSQLFLLTHKFELFRQWVIQIEKSQRHIDGGATIQEIRMRYETERGGTLRRVPRIGTWTTNEKLSRRLRSLYHFLFARVATSLIESKEDLGLAERMELLSLVPNAARKMLEAFLSFRYPQHIGSFHDGLRAAMADLPDDAVRNRVERFLHAYSHNEEGDISAVVDPAEVGPVVQSLFELMRAVDEKHFDSMCVALEIDSVTLLS